MLRANATMTITTMGTNELSLAMAMYPQVADVVPDFGQASPHWWPGWSPSPGR